MYRDSYYFRKSHKHLKLQYCKNIWTTKKEHIPNSCLKGYQLWIIAHLLLLFKYNISMPLKGIRETWFDVSLARIWERKISSKEHWVTLWQWIEQTGSNHYITIGDRVRLWNECKKIVAILPISQGFLQAQRVARERHNLFQSYQRQHGPIRRNEKRKKLWLINFLCMASPFSNKVCYLINLH